MVGADLRAALTVRQRPERRSEIGAYPFQLPTNSEVAAARRAAGELVTDFLSSAALRAAATSEG